MSRRKFHVKKGDEVEVVSGVHKGATGRVLQILPAKTQVLVEGVRLIKKHERRSQDRPQGAIVEREGPIHISNVKRVDDGGSGRGAKKSAGKKDAA